MSLSLRGSVRSGWEGLRESYWFLPMLMAAASAGLALGVVEIDRSISGSWAHRLDWIRDAGPYGTRAVLGAIAGSMITVTGVVFSVTIVALTLASSQFGPRLLRNFLRDRGNQLVLGVLVATFLYSLLVLRAVGALETDGAEIRSEREGYVRLVDAEALMALARDRDLVLRLHRRPGDFVAAGASLARSGPGGEVSESVQAAIRAAFVLGPRRTPVQDLDFLIDQLTEMAVRALSPGVNDPKTAIACIHRLGAVITSVSQRAMPSPERVDEEGACASSSRRRASTASSPAVSIRSAATAGRVPRSPSAFCRRSTR